MAGARLAPFVLATVVLLPLAGTLSGCAGWVGGPATGPDGLALRDRDLRGLLVDGRYDLAYERIAGGDARVGDDLLRFQYEGLLAHYAGRFGRSNASLQAATDLAEERYTRSLSKSALSLVINDRILSYRPPAVERLLIHYYGALNYLGMGDPEGAGVEARRLSHLLDLYADRGELDGEGGRRLHATLRYLAGAAFEAIGEENDAAVAYRLARRLDEEGRLPAADGPESDSVGPGSGTVAGGATAVGADATGRPSAPEAWGEVLVVVERGFAAHRVERAATLLLWPDELETLRGVSGRALLEADDPAAELALGLAGRALTGRTGPTPRGSNPAAGAVRGAAVNVDADEPAVNGAAVPGAADGVIVHADGVKVRRARRGRSLPRALRVSWPTYARSVPARPYGGRVRLLATVAGASGSGAGGWAVPAEGLALAGPAAGGDVASATPPASTPGDASLRTEVAWVGDISGALIEEGKRDAPATVARAIVRAAAKLAIARGIEEGLEEEDEALGEIAGTLLSAAAAITERADTRGWSLLPDQIGLVRLRLPAGTGRLELELPGLHGGERLELGEVRVRPGRLVVVDARERV